MENKSFEDLEKDTFEDSDMFNSDLENINVNVWFNKLESRLQYCLVKDDAKEGFMQYKMLVAHAEILAISSKKVNEDEYRAEVEDLVKKHIPKSEDDYIKEMKESMIKYRVILKNLLKQTKSDLNISF